MKNLVLVINLLIFLALVFSFPAKAQNPQELSYSYLPVILKNYNSEQPIWVKNPDNLPPANGWPGWTGEISTTVFDCSIPLCSIYFAVFSPPKYAVVEGQYAIFPDIGEMGNPTDGCFAAVVAETLILQGDDHIDMWTPGSITLYRMTVPDPSLAPPLEWLAQAKVDVQEKIPGCVNVDLGVYTRPSRIK